MTPRFERGRALAVFLSLSVFVHLGLLAWGSRGAMAPSAAMPASTITLTLSTRPAAVSVPAISAPAVRPAVSGERRQTPISRAGRPSASSGAAHTPAVDLGQATIRAAAGAVMREQRETAARSTAGRLSPDATPPAKTPLQQSLEASARPECRHAYSGMGLLAIVPLVVDTATDRGCRW
ncbi:hypothetical protein [Paludibacterium purpuratum]|nr:hypothetical protein [Paludibacterium purpuratum]